jgi:hypothetical protein
MITLNSSAQMVNNKRWDLKKYNLGFMMGLNFSDMVTKTSLPYTDVDIKQTLYSIEVQSKTGISLGIITNIKISDNFDFRFIPTVAIQQRNYKYQLKDSITEKKLEAAYLDLPVLLRIKSNFYQNKRVYVITGFKMSSNLVSDKKVKNNPSILKTNPIDFSLEMGVGIDLYGERVKVCPELRYSMGLINIYNPENTHFGEAVHRLSSQLLTLVINFE